MTELTQDIITKIEAEAKDYANGQGFYYPISEAHRSMIWSQVYTAYKACALSYEQKIREIPGQSGGWIHRFNSEQDFLNYLKQEQKIAELNKRLSIVSEQLEAAIQDYNDVKSQLKPLIEALEEVKNFHEGNGKYNFMHMNENDRGNASFDAWQLIFEKINELLTNYNKSNEPISKEQTRDELKLYEDYVYWPKEWFEQIVAYCRECKIDVPKLIDQQKENQPENYWKKRLEDLENFIQKGDKEGEIPS